MLSKCSTSRLHQDPAAHHQELLSPGAAMMKAIFRTTKLTIPPEMGEKKKHMASEGGVVVMPLMRKRFKTGRFESPEHYQTAEEVDESLQRSNS